MKDLLTLRVYVYVICKLNFEDTCRTKLQCWYKYSKPVAERTYLKNEPEKEESCFRHRHHKTQGSMKHTNNIAQRTPLA